MAVDFSPEQLRVIQSRDRNLLVSAAAGAGKTAVLVERILSLLTEKERKLFVAFYLQRRDAKDIAEEMDISEDNVRVRATRIKHKIKKKYKYFEFFLLVAAFAAANRL